MKRKIQNLMNRLLSFLLSLLFRMLTPHNERRREDEEKVESQFFLSIFDI